MCHFPLSPPGTSPGGRIRLRQPALPVTGKVRYTQLPCDREFPNEGTHFLDWLAGRRPTDSGPGDGTPIAGSSRTTLCRTEFQAINDPRPLPAHVEEFLADGPPPVHCGLGSMRAAEETSRTLVDSTRALGQRLIISQGWGNLGPIDAGSDCLLVDDVAHEKLFPRVMAVVHHGGAGTTTVAASAGVAQVILPHLYDQYYWAHRVQHLGVGAAAPARDELNVIAIVSALRYCMQPETRERASALARRIEKHGTRIAAERLVRQCSVGVSR